MEPRGQFRQTLGEMLHFLGFLTVMLIVLIALMVVLNHV